MKKYIFILMLGILWVAPGFANPAQDDSMKAFATANMAYREGKYSEAISGYESILAKGWESGPVYYNLGNSYFKAGQAGKALLNYERAKRSLPRDPDLLMNERYVLSLTGEPEQTNRSWWQKLWERHIQFYTFDEMALILMVLIFLIGAAHLAGLYFPAGRFVAVRVIVGLGVIFIIYTVGFLVKAGAERGLSVVVKKTSAKFEPSEKATVYFELLEGQKVKILEQGGQWQKIRRLDGPMGWILRDDIEEI